MMATRRSNRGGRLALAVALASMVSACATAPEYQKPPLDLPAAWKVEPPWRASAPADDLPKGDWWRRFGDTDLEQLAQKALANSPTLALATARLTQARSTLAAAQAAQMPQVGIAARDIRTRIAAARPLNNYAAPNFSTVQTDMFEIGRAHV